MTVSSAPAARVPPLANPAPKGRVRELEDPLNHYLYHPLAFRLAKRLQPTGITPNAVSAASGGLICLAAVLYTGLAWPIGALAGFACHLSWHVADGADGDLARLTGRTSPLGEFIDGAADYLGHIFLYLLLAAVLDDGFLGGWAWLLATVSGVSRIAQSNHAETHRRQFLWRVYGIPWLGTQRTAGKPALASGWLGRTAAGVVRAYLALGEAMAPYAARIDKFIESASGDEHRQAELRARIRQASAGSLTLQKILGANPRTILLGFSMIAGTPLWYFLIEAVALNGVLLISVVYQNGVERRLLATLR